MAQKESAKAVKKKGQDKTTGLYKIAAEILKKVKTGGGYKTELYQAKYPNKMLLNAVLMNVFKWEKVIDVLVDKSGILSKEKNMNRELVYVLITELMWSKFGLKGSAKNIIAVKNYKNIFVQLMEKHELEKLSTYLPPKVWKPRFFRINTLVTTVEDVIKKLTQLKFNKLKTPTSYVEFLELIKSEKFKGNNYVQDIHIKELLVFNSKVKFYNLEDYKNGSLIIQDKASCLSSYLLNPEPGSTVLDMCAAPGMKTSHLAAIMHNEGKLYAVDRCKERFILLQKMLENYNVKNAETFNMDALTFPYYNNVKYVLVDPSCSGSGIVDRVRNDSVKQDENFQIRLKKLANVHAQLLNHALKSYPDLERLVYSTCSANVEENEAVVDEALSVNGNFKLLDVSKLVKGWTNKGVPGYDCSEKCFNAVPNFDCTNGFFIAVFVRRDFEDKDTGFKEDLNMDDSNIDESKTEIVKNSSLVTKNEKSEKSFAKKSKKSTKNSLKTSQLNNNDDVDFMLPVKTEKLLEKLKSKVSKTKKIKLEFTSVVENKNLGKKVRCDLTSKSNNNIDMNGMPSVKIEKLHKKLKTKKNKTKKIKLECTPDVESKKKKKKTVCDITSQINNNVDMDSKPSIKTENLQGNSKTIANEIKKINMQITSDVKSKNVKRRIRRAKLEQCLGKRKTTKLH